MVLQGNHVRGPRWTGAACADADGTRRKVNNTMVRYKVSLHHDAHSLALPALQANLG